MSEVSAFSVYKSKTKKSDLLKKKELKLRSKKKTIKQIKKNKASKKNLKNAAKKSQIFNSNAENHLLKRKTLTEEENNVSLSNEDDSDECPMLVEVEENMELPKDNTVSDVHKTKRRHKRRSKKNVSLLSSKGDLSAPYDNITVEKYVLKWFLYPITPEEFFKKCWEISPFHMSRQSSYYTKIFSSKILDFILRNNVLRYGHNVDVVFYENEKRENINLEGRAYAAALWDFYNNGCSIRILNPHTYSTKLQALLNCLQEYFGTMAGANLYLTPPGSQGFAPHYDDIEAFVLQIEGRKHWKLYAPM